MIRGTAAAWSIPSGIPLFAYSFSYDALTGFFSMALAVLVGAVSVYSFSYLKEFEGKRNIAFFGFLYHLLLLSLTLVFTAANAFLFLVAWEVMALAAYGLVTFYYEDRETRRAGLLYVIMAHIDAGCLLLGFALLINASGSAEFATFRPIVAHLSGAQQTAAFVLFFLGFGIKAGIIPFHIWLPAAHPVAPSNISALLSGIVIKTGIYGMARIFLDAAVATFVASALGDSKIRISAPNIVLVATASGIVARSGILGLTLSTLLAVTMFRKALGTSPGRYMAERHAGRL